MRAARLRHTLQHWRPATTPPRPPLASRPLTSTFTPVGIPLERLGQRLSFGTALGTKLIVSTVRLPWPLPQLPNASLSQPRDGWEGQRGRASSVCASFVMAICINKSLALPVGASFAGGGRARDRGQGGSFWAGAGWYSGFVASRGWGGFHPLGDSRPSFGGDCVNNLMNVPLEWTRGPVSSVQLFADLLGCFHFIYTVFFFCLPLNLLKS